MHTGRDLASTFASTRTSRSQPTVAKRCAKPGCAAAAEVYVPKTRLDMNDRHWLCREHLREHNQRWNYFAGMSDQEIERFCLDA